MLHVHRAERADGLVVALGDRLAGVPGDPLQPETVAVPTRGMERWLAQTLSERFGVCANVEFPSPWRVVADAVATASGVDPETDPWRTPWALLEVIERHLDEPWLARLRRHLGDPDDEVRRARRLGVARHLSGLFAAYELHRADMVLGWARGEDGHWQAELWRHLRAHAGVPSPAERLAGALPRLREQDGPRLSVFGLTRLPAGHLDVLAAIAARREVHLLLLHPSPVLWERLRGSPPVRVRREDPTVMAARNPLLASWGRDSRELQLVLARAEHEDHHHAVEHPSGTRLAALQRTIREDAPAPEPGVDGSLEIHACHGRARQVEVLRDAILHTLEADPTLEPRDVIVMCPDIEAFAPLIQATFGEHGALRVRLADRSLRQTNPVLGVVAALLELAEARVTASQVLDLADREPVRRRFRFSDDDLTRLQEWIAASGTRWGLDARHRAPWNVDNTATGTWRFGVDRLLAGVTMTGDGRRRLHGILPLDDVDSLSIELAGNLAELLDRLARTVEAFALPQSAAGWAQALGEAADAFAETTARDAWQRAELQGILDELAAGTAEALDVTEVRRALADRLAGRPTRANFRTGHLTACTLVPMRSVPHRVVCLLGLDDDVFPRKGPRDGDDLLLAEPHVGERDPRAEDRQLLLDAVLAARQKLIVTYSGHDERTNAERPPAVPVGELLDIVGREAVVHHPLQPFDPRNFDAAAPRSFDPATLAGARALRAPRREPAPFLAGELPPLDTSLVALEDLVRFAEHPVRRFLRGRLGLELRDFTREVQDGLPIEFDNLERWGVGARMLEARLAGAVATAAREAELRSGRLPPGELGKPLVAWAEPLVEQLVAAAGEGEAETVDVSVELADGRRVRGTVPDVCGTTLRTVTFSTLAPPHRIRAWVRFLALCADGGAFGARTIGRFRQGVAQRTLAPIAPEEARRELAALLDLYERGMRAPLPLPCRTSAAFAESGHLQAEREWKSSWRNGEFWEREDVEPEYRRAFGAVLGYEELAARPGYEADARALWDPLREREA